MRAEERVESERERVARCEQSLVVVACRQRDLEAAEAALADATAAEERVADACRREHCLPGWLEGETGPESMD